MKSPTQKMFADEVEEAKKKPNTRKRTQKPKENPEAKEEVVHDVKLSSANHNILDLPSNGKLWYGKSVEYRDIMVGDEEILSLASAGTYARTLNSVIKGILNDCEFYEDMTIYDRDFALVWLWANNYNPIKEVNIKCRNQSCGVTETHKVDLTQVEVTDIKENIPVPFTLKLKNSKMAEVNIRLNTVQDEINVEAYINDNPKSNFAMLMLVSSIDIGFDMTLAKKLEWVRTNVTSTELGVIRNFHKYFKFGVNDIIEHTCSQCKEVTKGALPFQAEDILYPTVSTDFEELLRTM